MIYRFSDKTCAQVNKSGGKGASLAFLTQNNIPVPQGFVVSTEVFKAVVGTDKKFQKILEEMKKIKVDDSSYIYDLSKRFKEVITQIDIPKDIEEKILNEYDDMNLSLVAVRSSATSEDSKSDSWAGELETYLNIEKTSLFPALRKCWSSLFSERAITYRIEKNLLNKDISVAVVVQEMIQSDVSGVAFTVHPVSGRKDHLLIESVYGLGEAIVSGEVTPDTYLLDKSTLTVLRVTIRKQDKMLVLPRNLKGTEWISVPKKISTKQKVPYEHIMNLGSVCTRLEGLYKYPQDIEWSYRNNAFFIIQSRPITTI